MPTNPTRATVRRTLLEGKKAPDAISTLSDTCAAGAQCPEVQSSPIAAEALANLTKSVAAASVCQTNKNNADNDARTAGKALRKSFRSARIALTTYESVVADVADGDAVVINKAGLLSRDETPAPTPALEAVTKVNHEPGKNPCDADIGWPEAAGASSYALEVNFSPLTPNAPWIAHSTGTRRTRVVKAPTPASQFLVRVAAVSGDGTRSEWTDPVLVTAR